MSKELMKQCLEEAKELVHIIYPSAYTGDTVAIAIAMYNQMVWVNESPLPFTDVGCPNCSVDGTCQCNVSP